jgi:hypothetical protein
MTNMENDNHEIIIQLCFIIIMCTKYFDSLAKYIAFTYKKTKLNNSEIQKGVCFLAVTVTQANWPQNGPNFPSG